MFSHMKRDISPDIVLLAKPYNVFLCFPHFCVVGGNLTQENGGPFEPITKFSLHLPDFAPV